MQKLTALGYTAFDLAAQHTNLTTVKMLLEDGTNAGSTNHSLNNEDHMPTTSGYGQADINLLRGSLRWSQCVGGDYVSCLALCACGGARLSVFTASVLAFACLTSK